jgi:hypothetical protein
MGKKIADVKWGCVMNTTKNIFISTNDVINEFLKSGEE